MLDKREIEKIFTQKMMACALYGINKECHVGLHCSMANAKGSCILGAEAFGVKDCLFREDRDTGEIYRKGKN